MSRAAQSTLASQFSNTGSLRGRCARLGVCCRAANGPVGRTSITRKRLQRLINVPRGGCDPQKVDPTRPWDCPANSCAPKPRRSGLWTVNNLRTISCRTPGNSRFSHEAKPTKNQQDRQPALSYEPGGRRFESCWARQNIVVDHCVDVLSSSLNWSNSSSTSGAT